VVARIADLAEHTRTRPVPELGNRGAGSGQGLEEALGTAIAARGGPTGVVTLDVEPERLAISLVNRYLEVKRSGRL